AGKVFNRIPFINKTDINSFNDQLVRIFNQYKHALGFNYKTFNKLMSEVLAYKPEAKLKELTPVMLTGYLADNIFYKKSEKNTKDEDNE
ncbi:MAG: hypothetical protein IAE91_12030, partial [Ignavibacteriaceae bacterium]|nr:hypothetical protein [Ignavibacteriaceae bacterium]